MLPKNGKGKGGAGKEDDEEGAKAAVFEIASKNDYQLSQALNLLKAWQVIQKR